ncbi:molybdate ABC transporter substrate-binding protein [Brevibacillus sp. AG]|uniref:molybdate ABC transporter substrate-binding protein n=1 Tax=Brevibacillus sp. AG TaxID=3020891 RepID=UPI000853D3F2|nr:molybdate ABC transporter substrate-binding protein [Brevibacillus sp. AG]MDC0760030.1 molybdate ABC transporter substrate-binding protein [Brevibacillus sp. AG]
MKKHWLALLTAFCLMLTACSTTQTAPQASEPAKTEAAKIELMISAAASLTDALNELKTQYETEHPGTTLTFNFGGSGKLATQITQGAPSDVFLSASKKDMDGLEEQQLIAKDTRQDFTKNSLVLIAGNTSAVAVSSFEELSNATIKHIAVGEPETVPAGRYAKETLDTLKMWDSLSSQMVFGSDVRQVLTFVESGNAEVGIVYSSDAAASKNVKVLATAKPEWHKPIVYPGAVVSASKNPDAAKAFLAYLTSDKGKAILQKYGFQ